jgi:aldose 1-epimerase
VFTQPVRDFIAIEPVSHVNNAINLAAADTSLRLEDLGVVLLEPGQTLSASMRIAVARSAAPLPSA